MTASTEERLAALKARQGNRRPPKAQTVTAPPVAPDPFTTARPMATDRFTTTAPIHPGALPVDRMGRLPPVEIRSAPSFGNSLPVPADPQAEPAPMDRTLLMSNEGLHNPVHSSPILAEAAASSAYRPRPASDRPRSYNVPWERVSAGGAAVVSFVSMIVAMGPILKGTASVAAVADPGAAAAGDAATATSGAAADPVAPAVDIQVAPVDPNALQADLTSTVPATDPSTDMPLEPIAGASTDAATATDPTAAAGAGTVANQPASTAAPAPTTAPPATAPPSSPATAAQAPATQAPTTQAPTTQAPTTQPPTTQAPTTQAPTTQAPTTTTAPPRSGGSGG